MSVGTQLDRPLHQARWHRWWGNATGQLDWPLRLRPRDSEPTLTLGGEGLTGGMEPFLIPGMFEHLSHQMGCHKHLRGIVVL